jgi:hypothetical protein
MARRKEPEIEVTNASYRRWLQAGRPPFKWFMALAEPTQQGLADIGLTFHVKLQQELLEESEPAGPVTRTEEAGLARELASKLVDDILSGRKKGSEASSIPSMAGLGERKKAAEKSANGPQKKDSRLLGREPDGETK